ncbi:MAG: ABC transporter ATP-binding protein [Pseudomonadota bacterium]|nr:ABC transporter ATP-binding protein [Pseudomonadota bacterium]
MISVKNLNKIYPDNFYALSNISLGIKQGEVFALLGPNGAGKTTLISSVCGLTKQTSGEIKVSNFDTIKDYKKTRSLIGLVPQEFPLENYESVLNTVNFSRGLFGKKRDENHVKKVLQSLKLWDKKDSPIITLSGGMKRRVLIAKALSHNPKILFLDEPTSGVDIQLRKEMWEMILKLKRSGVTVILTTHYIKEAETIADRIGILNKGELILVEKKENLINKFGEKTIIIEFGKKIYKIPKQIKAFDIFITDDNLCLVIKKLKNQKDINITNIIKVISELEIPIIDIKTEESSLEDIFLDIINEKMKSEFKFN